MAGLADLSTTGVESLRVGRVAAPLREQVVDVLREAILDFRLRPGQRLIERELIEQIGVSRTTIREVLRQLAAEGLVTTIPQKGAIVVVPSPEEAAELYDVRLVLEAAAVTRFVRNATPEQLRALRAAVDEMERVAGEGSDDVRGVLRANDEFYEVLLQGAGNRAFHALLAGVQARVRVLRASSLSQPGRPAAAVGELRVVVDAIEAGDGERAAQLTAEHLEHAERAGLQAITAAGRAGDA
ncbi:GntR family transcriptional regulator [Conexibacter sp. CPCC 206217]|uniref:GntR family transcriptional regulator n=1 Tax=Conexibacter sp. CPCC 206217 TaxID=3064574 RepID=UPI00271E222B|nr:GntR family transcriptional regulator [Conexibacter sp. CPCC 206217]MDO8211784.1 GntR family transcriptional regulator [Conexibacter sp. CPCC 206217]